MRSIPRLLSVLLAALLAALLAVGCGQYAGVHQPGTDTPVQASPVGASRPTPSPAISPDDGVEGPGEDAIVGDSTLLGRFRTAGGGSKEPGKDGGSKDGKGPGHGSTSSGTGSGSGDRSGKGERETGDGGGKKKSGKDGGSTATSGDSRKGEGRKGSGTKPRPIPRSVQEVLLKGADYNSTILPEGFPLLICPVIGRYAYSDDYGAPRYAGGYHPHAGNDIFATMFTPIVAPFDGYVEKAPNTLGGLAVRVHGQLGYVYMAHLSAYSPRISYPSSVEAGTVVGFVGNSGDARGTSPHDHFEWHPATIQAYDRVISGTNGAVDPYRYLRVVCPPGPA